MLLEPSSVTLSNSITVWSSPASAVGGILFGVVSVEEVPLVWTMVASLNAITVSESSSKEKSCLKNSKNDDSGLSS